MQREQKQYERSWGNVCGVILKLFFIRESAPPVMLCYRGANCIRVNTKRVSEMSDYTLRESNNSPKQDIYTSCVYEKLWY